MPLLAHWKGCHEVLCHYWLTGRAAHEVLCHYWLAGRAAHEVLCHYWLTGRAAMRCCAVVGSPAMLKRLSS